MRRSSTRSSPVSEDSGSRTMEEADADREAEPTEAPAPGRDLDAELAQVEDRYKRALADLDNYRKRSAREVERRVAEGTEALLLDWLDAVDSVERALRIEPEGPLVQGLRAVLEQMDSILARQGVDRIGAVG